MLLEYPRQKKAPQSRKGRGLQKAKCTITVLKPKPYCKAPHKPFATSPLAQRMLEGIAFNEAFTQALRSQVAPHSNTLLN